MMISYCSLTISIVGNYTQKKTAYVLTLWAYIFFFLLSSPIKIKRQEQDFINIHVYQSKEIIFFSLHLNFLNELFSEYRLFILQDLSVS